MDSHTHVVGPGSGQGFSQRIERTKPGPESVPKLARAGVSTIVTMHWTDKLKEVSEKEGMYVVIAGHDSSDSIGMNLILDELEKKGITTYACSGFFRHKRT